MMQFRLIILKNIIKKFLSKLDKLLPGSGDVSKRINDFKNNFIIPKEKLDTVFSAAIEECRKRTLQHIQLPPNENFKVEYVTNKPWGGYNWYKGNSYSVIQVNTDLPIYIDRAVDLASHEGYPGHHVYNALLEKNLYRQKGWVEFCAYALFSPQSLIAEGSANFGIEVAFPGDSRIKFEKEVLFPLPVSIQVKRMNITTCSLFLMILITPVMMLQKIISMENGQKMKQ